MVKGLDIFREYFAGFEDQYVLIGGAACDILFASNAGQFRATRDLDIVLIVESLTKAFGERLWEFIKSGNYQNKVSGKGLPQFYRFDKPTESEYPKMIELFSRTGFPLKEQNGITPIHVDDAVSSLSAILLDEDYYHLLLNGRTMENGLSVLKPEYLILFKAKAYLDLKERKERGESIDSYAVKKHKNDILRIAAELFLQKIDILPEKVHRDFQEFLKDLEMAAFDYNLLKNYGLRHKDVVERLRSTVLV